MELFVRARRFVCVCVRVYMRMCRRTDMCLGMLVGSSRLVIVVG